MRLIDADAFERAIMFSDDEDLQDVIYRLRDFPSAQPGWIPCDKELPEELEEVLMTWVNTKFREDRPFSGTGFYYRGKWYWPSEDSMDDVLKVVAWMPLPEPYKEEANG